LNNGTFSILEIIITRVGLIVDIVVCIVSFYLLKFKRKSMNISQKIIVSIVFLVSIAILGLFIYLIIGFGSMPDVEPPIPATKP